MADSSHPDGPRAGYAERLLVHRASRDDAARASVRLSNLRAGTFLVGAAAWITFDVLPPPWRGVVLGSGLLLTAGFVGLVVVHRRVRHRERWEGTLAGLADEGLRRIDRDWDGLHEALPAAERPVEPSPADHPYAGDLDVLGRASLFRLAGPVTSERGRAILRAWLLEASAEPDVTARQGAVRELAPLQDLRTHFAALGRIEGPDALRGLDRFMAWAEGAPVAASDRRLRVLAWALPPVLVLGLVGYFSLGWLPWWILPAVAQVRVLRRHRTSMQEAFGESVLGGPPLRSLVPQLELLSGRAWEHPLLASVGRRLGQADHATLEHLRRLSRLLDSVESRKNAFYATVAPVLLLDVHLWMSLDRWRAAHGPSVRDWLEALGTWEALSALATLSHDNPDWAFPDPGDPAPGGETTLHATALGHPLLPPAACVRNDVTVGPPGTFLFVTGSNMSGKSTLLRALGANAVLAGTGAPVCADALALPPVRVHTSMRIEDSLAEGISLFMAELLRIKGVVEAATAARDTGRPVLYLLDEILHGTNTAERRIAARGVIRHLLHVGAIGAVSSHDLTLAEAPDLGAAARAVHFREEVAAGEGERAALTFDYTLRQGVATTRNALKLLDAVGLGALADTGEPAPE